MGSTAHSAAVRTASGAGTSTSGGAAKPAGVAAETFKRLLTGSGPGQMNLGAVRSRAEELKRSLDQIITALELYADRVQWGDTLDKFGVINLQMHQLAEELRPLLKFYAVHPKAVNAANAAQLPLLLATRTLPEMEAQDRALLGTHRAAAGQAPVGAQYEALGLAIEHLNGLVDALTQHNPSTPQSGLLDAKGPVRRAMAQQLHAAAAHAVPPVQPKQALSAGGRPAAQQKLEGASLLMAAVTRGEGLA